MITESGVSRTVTKLEAIIMQLLVGAMAAKPRAFSVMNQYCKLKRASAPRRASIEFVDDKQFYSAAPVQPVDEGTDHEKQ